MVSSSDSLTRDRFESLCRGLMDSAGRRIRFAKHRATAGDQHRLDLLNRVQRHGWAVYIPGATLGQDYFVPLSDIGSTNLFFFQLINRQ